MKNIIVVLIALSWSGASLASNAAPSAPEICLDSHGCPQVKWNPGHYMDTDTIERVDPNHERNLKSARLLSIENTPFKGALVRYGWGVLEPTKNNYDFSRIRAHRDVLASIGKRLIIQVQDRTFRDDGPPPDHIMPAYLASDPVYEGGWAKRGVKRGTAPKLWLESVMDRQIALQAALAAEFDADPWVEIFRFEETALFNIEPEGYTQAKMLRQYKRLADALELSWTQTTKYIMINYFHGDSGTAELLDYFIARGLAIGGPDILPRSRAARLLTGQTDGIDRRNRVPTIFGIEWHSSNGTWTVEEIQDESFHVNRQHYITWVHKNSDSGLNWRSDYFPFVTEKNPPTHVVRPTN